MQAKKTGQINPAGEVGSETRWVLRERAFC